MTEPAAQAPAPTMHAAHFALAIAASEVIAADDAAFKELVKAGITPEPATTALTEKLRQAFFTYRNAVLAAEKAEPQALIATGIAQVNRLAEATDGTEIEDIKSRLLAIFTTLSMLLDYQPA